MRNCSSIRRARGSHRALRVTLYAFGLLLVLAACGEDGPGDMGIGTGPEMEAGVDGGNLPDAMPPPEDSGATDSGGEDSGSPDAHVPNGDAGERACAVNCAALNTECRSFVCNLETEQCEGESSPDGTACGSQVLDNCSAPDTCQAGMCIGNHAAASTPCGDQNVACHVNDACDGNGQCTDNGLLAVDTPCGSGASSACDAPDTCDAAGECAPNYASIDAPCGDQDELCHYDDTCDGNGSCVDNGLWLPGACPPSAPVAADGRCVWGRTLPATLAQQVCLPGADVCDDTGTARFGHEFYASSGGTTDGTACGNASPAHPQCDAADSCSAGVCVTNAAPALSPCGDQATNTVCDRPDSCDGFGNCELRHADGNTVCAEPAGECFLEARCNGSGTCAQASAAPEGTTCGDPSDAVCDDPDACDGAGNCAERFVPEGESCGGAPIGPCDVTNQCDGSGQCETLTAEPGTVCGDADNDCRTPDTCNELGECVDNGIMPENSACGSDSVTECDLADRCDDSGNCLLNRVPTGTECGDPAGTCMVRNQCNGEGSCNDGSVDVGCVMEMHGSVFDPFSGEPLAGIAVEWVGSNPLVSGVSDVDGAFSIPVPVGERIFIRAHATSTHWGLVQSLVLAPSDDGNVAYGLLSNDSVIELLEATGVAAADEQNALLWIGFDAASGLGGETATVTPGCEALSCGPVVFDDMGAAVLSNTLLSGGGAEMVYRNLPPSTITLEVAGAPGINGCAIAAADESPALVAHTISFVQASCLAP